jgi:copper transport protein
MRRRVLRHVVAILACVTLALLTNPLTGLAHAELLSTTPADGTVVAQPPEVVVLGFSEPVTPIDDGGRLFASGADPVAIATQAEGTSIRYLLPASLPDGSYVVTWRVVSADGHPIAGAIQFAIGAPGNMPIVIDAPGADGSIDTWLALTQGLGYIGLLGICGWLFYAFFIARRSDPVASGIWIATGITMLALVLWVPLTVARQQGEGLDLVADFSRWTSLASRDLWAMVLLASGGLVLATLAGNRQVPFPRAVLVSGMIIALGAVSILGHTRLAEPTWLMVGSNITHTIAASIWFGGLLGLVASLRHAPRNDDLREVTGLVARFSTIAGIVLLFVIGCGVLSGWLILRSLRAIVETDYGRILLLKAGLVGLVVLVAAWNRYRLVPVLTHFNPGHAWQRLKYLLLVEATVLLCVAMVTGFLVNESPRQQEAAAAPTQTLSIDQPLGEGRITGSVTPGQIGDNTIELFITDAAGVPINPIETPRLEWMLDEQGIGPLTFETMSHGIPGEFMAVVPIPLSGEWTVTVIVRVSTFTSEHSSFTVPIP